MNLIVCGCVLMLIASTSGFSIDRNDEKSKEMLAREFIFTTDKLPSDDRYMCSIGNGHIATHIFSEALYMNGLYNGKRGESHRARIPAWNNIKILNDTLNEAFWVSPKYSLDTLQGAFLVNLKTETADVVHRIYAHRFYTRSIINQFIIKSTGGASQIKIGQFPGPNSDDIKFESPLIVSIQGRSVLKSCGTTIDEEDSRYQTELRTVCAYWMEIPSLINVKDGETVLETYVMTIDLANSTYDPAFKEMNDVLQMNGSELFEKHVIEWDKHINTGIYGNIYGNEDLSKMVNGIWYYLLTSLPSPNTNQPSNCFYGLSPGGLSRGSHLRDYQGHSFWDTETWMYPSILLFHPELAKQVLNYRMHNINAATDLAISSNHKGIRFPWESAYTGAEVTPDCCPEVANYQHHITGCIAFAIRQYIATTNDGEWFESGGCKLIGKIAEFWASRVEFNNATGFYDIKNAMGPDEDHPNITNSVFTNVIAGLSLYLGDYASCLCKSDDKHWSDIAKKIALPYDADLDYHPQYDGYKRPTIIKQADAVLLGFPLLYKMNPSTKENDLLYYENVTRDNGPAMTWSMHTIGHIRLGNMDQAEKHFNRSYQPYMREPYYIWTEAREPEIGAVNFITGMGGFMQTLTFGYGGMSIYLDRIEIVKPQLPPQTTRMDINNIKFLGTEMNLSIRSAQSLLSIISVNEKQPLIIKHGDIVVELGIGTTVMIDSDRLYEIRKATAEKCALPLDIIGLN